MLEIGSDGKVVNYLGNYEDYLASQAEMGRPASGGQPGISSRARRQPVAPG
jgi:hypothetical protein